MEVFLEFVELDAEISEHKASTGKDLPERQNPKAPKEEVNRGISMRGKIILLLLAQLSQRYVSLYEKLLNK